MHHQITSSLESTSRFIPSASLFLSWFTSSSTSQLISVIIPTLVIHHSFSLSLQAQNLSFQQILPIVDFFYLLDCLTITGPDRTYYAHHFIFIVSHFNFLFIPCGRLSWLIPVSFLLHECTLNTHYRIVSYRIASIAPSLFIARQHTDARYWYSKSVRLFVRLSVRQ